MNDSEEEHYRYSTTKYWVRMSDVSAVKHHILQHLPVYQYSDVSSSYYLKNVLGIGMDLGFYYSILACVFCLAIVGGINGISSFFTR